MILITGASSGIGEATARAFAASGKSVYLASRQSDRLREIAKDIESRHGVEAVWDTLDVSDPISFKDWEKRASPLLDRVTTVINNAGLAKGFEPFQESSPEAWDAMIDTNLKGLLRVTHSLLKRFIPKRSGHIVNVGSVAGHYPYPKGHVYVASKAAVRAFTEALRMDLLGTGIRVTELSPGLVETGFSRVRFDGDEAKARAVYAGLTPLSAEDVAQAIVWAVERPAHVNVQEIILYPTAQASPTQVHRSSAP